MSRDAFERTVKRVAKDPRMAGRASEDKVREALRPIAADADRKAAAEGSSYKPSEDTKRPIPKAKARKHRIALDEVPAADPLVHDLNRRHGMARARAAIIAPSTRASRKRAAKGWSDHVDSVREMLERKK